MPKRYVITKVTATGEQLTTEIAQCHPVTGDVMHNDAELSKMLQEATESSDERMFDMNMRMLESYKFDEFFSKGEWLRVKQVMEVLAGRMTAQLLHTRWTSEREETAELEMLRAEYAQRVGLHDSVSLDVAPISSVMPMQVDREPLTKFIPQRDEPSVTEKDVQAEVQYPFTEEVSPELYDKIINPGPYVQVVDEA